MTYFIKLENGVPVGNPVIEQNFRQLFPQTSFPAYFVADVVEPLGWGIYDFSNQPTAGKYKKAVEVTPVRSEAGIWRQAWALIDMDDAEKLAVDVEKANDVRSERSWKLSQSDWTQLPDSPVDKAAWAVYRQALRDVPQQAGFPWEVTWPAQPE